MYLYLSLSLSIHKYIYIYIYIHKIPTQPSHQSLSFCSKTRFCHFNIVCEQTYGQFSKFHVCFCGLDSGNLKFETVRTNKQHICF